MINESSDIKHDIELEAQSLSSLKQYIKDIGKKEAITQTDPLGRTLFHQCALYGNLEGLKYLVKEYGKEYLTGRDKHGNTCAHFAG